MQVNTDVLDTVLLSLHPAEVNTDKKVPTSKDQESPFQGDCGNLGCVGEKQDWTRAAAQVSSLSKNLDTNVNTRFYPIIKLEKVEKEEMRILMENLPEQYSAKLGA